MDPVWTLFTRRTFSRLAYWLSALGYSLRDRSVSNRLYLVYFCAFWSTWAFAVFALLGGGVAGLFTEIQGFASPPQWTVRLANLVFVAWALVTLWQVSRRSPFVFNEEDAYLLCQTPVSRRKVGLAWFVQGVLGTALLFAAGTVILSFALIEWRIQGEITFARIVEYLRLSLLALVQVLPVQIGWQAALWGIGALRLHQRKELVWPRWIFFALILALLAGFILPGIHTLLFAPFNPSMQAAFLGEAPVSSWLGSLGLGCLTLAAGLAFLSLHAGKIHLGRAAQETSHVAAINLARRYAQTDLADSILLRRRLGTTRKPSRLLAQPAGNVLFRKDLLQSLRAFRLRELTTLAWIFGLSLGMLRAPNPGIQMVMAGVWTIAVGGFAIRRLRSDLARWWIFRSLPLRPEDLLKQELILAWAAASLLSGLALAFSSQSLLFTACAVVLLPLLAANAALAATDDILRRSKARVLMAPSLAEENVPQQNVLGVLQGLVSVLIPFGVLVWADAYPGQPVWGAAAIPLAAGIAWLNAKMVLSAYRWIE